MGILAAIYVYISTNRYYRNKWHHNRHIQTKLFCSYEELIIYFIF